MPDLCASMRSIAKCVLPVLVGPRIAVTRDWGRRSPVLLCIVRKIIGPARACKFYGYDRGGCPMGKIAGKPKGTRLEQKKSESLTKLISSFVLIRLVDHRTIIATRSCDHGEPWSPPGLSTEPSVPGQLQRSCDAEGASSSAPLLAAAIVGQKAVSTSMVRTNDRPANPAGVGESSAKGASRSLSFGSELGNAGGFSGQAALYGCRS